jgi:hypothetical protein
MAKLHDCSAGLKRGAHLPDDCTGGRTEGDICTAGRKGCGYMITVLLAGTEKITARLRSRPEERCAATR